ncbi:probable LRR receptor-like serine/threonine-protein kinase At3g47570 [Magnolia sinica]|uniref:probable LRR receptor-like serine/threonine-protein kinase At3g47570 n=1 Tax=Magnolia sinica TaxID=86752 RepID=UPI00265A4167|nr:probable LRR receptor-like serine/threonine-protein kinase At3g47570 [Magnolia sinica]
MSRLYMLSLYQNSLTGSVPSSLGNCTYMQYLNLADNNLSGSLPKQLFSFPTLIAIYVGGNSFSGDLPLEAGYLKALQILNVSNNKLSGQIPSSLGNCLSLEYLWLYGNFFQGSIPSTFSTLRGLRSLDLSGNNLSGKIPKYLENLTALEYLNLSFNDFEGELPKQGVFRNASEVWVLGNGKLCGGIEELKLPACSSQASKKLRMSLASKLKFSIIGVVLCLISLSCFVTTLYWVRKSRKKPSVPPSLEDPFMIISYADLLKATDGFSSANLIGSGSFGSVYKGTQDGDGTVFAVKVLNLQLQGALRSFMAECEALRNIRHRNLIKILTCCSSIDYKGNEFKALVFEYMNNGSLDRWLRKDGYDQQRGNLTFIQRLNIALDVASALDYLHHHCQTPIVHRDLKPSNILLDDDMIAHVGDFGLARFLSEVAQTISLGVKGTIGYIAPEYAMGSKASTQGDVYSYEILLLEMITGKGPTNDMFKDNLSLHHFAKLALPERVMEIVDLYLFEEAKITQGSGNHINARNEMRDCLISMVRIGVLCSLESLRERMEMKNVVMEMHAIRDLYLRSEFTGMQVRSPLWGEEYLMGDKASTQGDVYSYGILLEMMTGKGPTDDLFKDNLSLHHFAKLALPEWVMEIVDPFLLEESKVTQGSGSHINTRNRMLECLISMVRISVLCSAESCINHRAVGILVRMGKANLDLIESHHKVEGATLSEASLYYLSYVFRPCAICSLLSF